MKRVTSADGTEIAYRTAGDGPSFVLVHGGDLGGDGLWNAIRPHLETVATVIVPDRRGHGESGDADEYSLDREVADIRAVIDAVDGTPVLFGHSFGGLCALEAARKTPVERLILYEPAVLTGVYREDATLVDEMTTLLEAGERHRTVDLYLRENMDAEVVERIRGPEMDDHAEIFVRQNRAVEQYDLDADLDISVPTHLLVSENGPKHLRNSIRKIHGRLSNSRLVELEGMGHAGVFSAPERVANEIRSFVAET